MCTTVRLSVLMFVSVLVCVTVGQNDQTLSPGARGAGVVEAVCSRLEASCAFSEDKLFTRRLAYVESYDGEHPDAFRPGYHGGIWQVDKAFFDLTVNPSVLQTLSQTIQKIKLSFGITWSTVKWEDLQKPLYSAIAARLYLQYKARAVTSGIPRSINEQATYWRTYYRPAGDTNKFVQDSNRLEKVCSSANGADIVFILDESGSVGSSNYLKVKSFVKDIVQSFDVGLAPHQTRFAVTTFSTSVYRRFDLNDYTTKSALLTAIDRIPYSGGSTYTDLALDELSKNSFTAARGARPREAGHPRVGIVVTDGRSTNPTRTLAAAKRVHDADIIVFAVGVGSSLNYQELEAIASKPVCLHQMLLNNFQEFESLKYIIQKRTCEAPIIITDNSTDVRPPPDGQNCQIKVPPSGTTVRVKSEEGSVTFFVASSTYPSNDYFEHKVVARPGRLGVLYVTKLNTSGGNDTMFCNIKGDNSSSNASIDGKPGDHDKCRHKECLNEGECVQDDTGKSWCECHPPYTGDKCQIEITTTTTTTTTTTPTTTTPTTTTPTTTTSTTTTPTTTTSTTTTPTTTTSTTTTTAPTTTTQSSQGGYNCDTNNPCTTGLISGGQFYFPHNDPSKFVQCSEWGQCSEMSCPSGLVWDTSALTCIPPGESNPETTTTTAPTTTTTQSSQGGYNCYTNNPCTPEHTSGGHFYFPHNDPSKFVQCSEWGQCYEMLCPPGLVWDTGVLTCVVRTTVSVVQTTNVTTPGVPDK